MAPPSKLQVTTLSLLRLVKEEASYHKELEQQQARIQKLESGSNDENAEYILNQERKALEETKQVFPTLKEKIKTAVENLNEQLEKNKEAGGEASTEEVTKAHEAVAKGLEAMREAS
ncbi:tubulin binding cofactor A [Patellaria atrata CBS 101060]|uniref:Tubulin-specific chaperone A n=1 Tax=Patellaria atrata CBS 101060 TaxID=1346257 RepID=A0A9P4S2X0_9PEZI|nr:tubulin binding cofactor A [Patellaria atrata CBS 101060]